MSLVSTLATETPRCVSFPSSLPFSPLLPFPPLTLPHPLLFPLALLQILQSGLNAAKLLSKPAYLFGLSPDSKVAHLNYLPKALITKEFNAKTWFAEVSKIVGGKGGGKDDGATGFGTEVGKVEEAVEEAKRVFGERK